ncbi:MAG TPA: hypothetical protein VJS30_21040 [Paraburkholderia sp.]|nr:hypothetical protein [Paraburkholderia sp.]
MKDVLTRRDVARAGDMTNRGGEVKQAVPNLTHGRVPVAFIGGAAAGGATPQKASR